MGACSSLCDQCSALCCRYFVLEIDTPQTRRQFDDVRWYLVHESTFVFIEKKKWYLGVYARCKHLQSDNRCGIYQSRPAICRQYSTETCDYHGGDYGWEMLFTSAEQLQRYAQEQLRLRRQKAKGKRKKRRTRSDKSKLPRLHVTLLAGGPDRLAPPRNGDGQQNGNGNGNGHGGVQPANSIPLPILRR
jgi:Fe-S-cluster containining protein